MGGARPKATIEDGDRLWLGKFPSRDDRFNLQRVEFATLDLARRCGLNVAQARLQSVGSNDVLMLRRFDREHTEDGYLRFGLVSGLTVLDCGDSHLDRERWSYDLVPTPVISLERRDLALTVGGYGRTASIYNLLSQTGRFGLSLEEARQEIERIVAVIQLCSKTEANLTAPATQSSDTPDTRASRSCAQ